MTRAAFLSAGGDPFLADFTLSLWKKHWYDEIDFMYVAYNNHAEVPQDVSYEFLRKWEKDPKVKIIYTPFGVGNGTPITQMLLGSKEDSVLLLEDDSFIFTPGVVHEWFAVIESGKADLVGSPRYAAGEIAEAARQKYGLDYSGIGDRGFGWWPSFFVCRRENLLATDLDFGSKEYPKGVYFKELDHTMETTEYTDTFTWTSLQLRNMGLRSRDIPQNHAHPFDIDFQRNKEGMFRDGDPKYIHGGSLSSGWGGYLNKKLPSIATDMEKQDTETRVAFWMICMAQTVGFKEFGIIYGAAILDLCNKCTLSGERINKKVSLYMALMHL